jgi:hypothetical protein
MGKSFAPSLNSEKTNQLNTNAPGKPKQVTSKQKPKPIVLVVLTIANFGVSVISAGTIHDLGRVKVPGTGPL